MNEFPELVLAEIFSFLSLRERHLLRAVNRRWKYVLEKYPKEHLYVCHSTSQFLDILERQDVLLIDRPVDLASIFSQHLKRALSELTLFASPITADLQNELSLRPSDFERLKALKIDGLQLYVKEFRLALPTLHTFSLKGFQFGQGVVLDCENLEQLTIHNFDKQQIVIHHPKGIKFLECQYLNDSFRALLNLEHLVALRIELSLVEFRKLQRLEVYPSWQDFDRLIRNVADERHLLHPEARILINGLPDDRPVDLRLFDLHKAFYQGSEKFLFLGSIQNEQIFANYSKLAENRTSIPFKTHINYSSLSSRFFGRIPDGFFRIFTNIQAVELHQKVQTKSLLSFLRAAKTVRKFTVFECELELFVEGPDGLCSVQSISELQISEPSRRISLDFLCHLQRLTSFHFHSFELPLQTVCRAFEACKYFDEFYFQDRAKENNFHLYRTVPRKDRFSLAERNGTTDRTKLETIFNLLSQDDKLNIV